jgi:hypothetical protein
MEKEKEFTPQHISDRIIQGYIDRLLGVGDEYKKEIKKVNPYSLEPTQSMFFESGFKHGVKPAPPATKKLRPAAESMFEFEIMRSVGDEVEVPQVIGSTYVKINIPGLKGDYYVRTSLLHNHMREFRYETLFRPCKGGERFIAIIHMDSKLLMENCIKRK